MKENEELNVRAKKHLILGLGNRILKDDAIGLIATEKLFELESEDLSVIPTEESGLALLDFIVGFEKVLVIDSMPTSDNVIRIYESSINTLYKGNSVCEHFVGLPEVIKLGEELGLQMPKEVRILIAQVPDVLTIEEGLSEQALETLPILVDRAKDIIRKWEKLDEECFY